jgi:hypothetical protein
MHSSWLPDHFHTLNLVHVRSYTSLSWVHYDQHPSSQLSGSADEEGYPRCYPTYGDLFCQNCFLTRNWKTVNKKSEHHVWNQKTKQIKYVEGQREVTGGGRGGGVNGSLIKFFCKNLPMSQVQTPKPKPYKKVMNTSTNSAEMISSKLWMHQKKNGINWTPG